MSGQGIQVQRGATVPRETAPKNREDSTLANALFFIPFGIWLALKALQRTSFVVTLEVIIPIPIVLVICMVVLAVREVLFGRIDEYSIYGFVAAAGLAVLGCTAQFGDPCDSVLIIFFARDFDFRKLARFCFTIIMTIMVVTFICVAAGILPDYVFMSEGRPDRHYLGFSYPNTVACFVLICILLWSAIRNERYGLVDIIASFVVAAVLFFLTDSRAFIAAACIGLALLAAWKYAPRYVASWRWLRVLAVWGVAIVAAAAVLLSVFYNPEIAWMDALNRLTSGRLHLAHEGFMRFGIPILSQDIPYGSASTIDLRTGAWSERDTSMLIDCAYMKLLLHCGLVALVVGVAICVASCKKLLDCGEWGLLACIATLSLYGLMEGTVLNLLYNAFLFLLALPIAKKALAPAGEKATSQARLRAQRDALPGRAAQPQRQPRAQRELLPASDARQSRRQRIYEPARDVRSQRQIHTQQAAKPMPRQRTIRPAQARQDTRPAIKEKRRPSVAGKKTVVPTPRKRKPARRPSRR